MIEYNGNNLELAHKDADRFIGLTSFLIAPKRAYHDELGKVTLFWDTSALYADIEFKGDEHFDLFSREYHDVGFTDTAVDNVAVESVTLEWCSEHLKALFIGVTS